MSWFVEDHGGRTDSGRFRGSKVGDCVIRACAIAFELPYDQVYDELVRRHADETGEDLTGSHGIHPDAYKPWIAERGAVWTPTMTIGSGTTVHVHPDELPEEGRHILRLSRHLAAWVEGELRDSHDSSRGGTRAVYGYWTI